MTEPNLPENNVSSLEAVNKESNAVSERKAASSALGHAQSRAERQDFSRNIGNLVDVVVKRRRRVPWLLILFVILPTAVAAAYYGYFASDVYVSESKFVVRTPQRAPQQSALGAMLQGTGFQRAPDESLSLHDYIQSRDALRSLVASSAVHEAFTRDGVDSLSKFPRPWGNDTFEALFKYYGQHISVSYDSNAAITTLKVDAFTAEDAHRINAALLKLSESLINGVNERARTDLIQYASVEIQEAQTKAKEAAVSLAAYRNRRALYDPERQSNIQLQQSAKLQEELFFTKSQLIQLKGLSPLNPQVAVLERRARAIEEEIAREFSKIAGGSNSFSDKAAEFERLQLDKAFADRQVVSALANLDNARNEARRKQLYLERIVEPNKPDYPIEPRRLRIILSVFVFGIVLWGVSSMFLAGVKEHQH